MTGAALKAINCTTCGAALPALAGHKAKALICSYCGSVMDRHDGYKVLAQYRDMPRPAGPFSLGMTGEVFGVEHTVVGIVGVRSVIEGEVYRWTNYQIYAPTHGYSWITWNDGHLTHSRKVRMATNLDPSWGFVPRSEFIAGDRSFKMFETYQAQISYIEGELTWVPKLGDTVGAVDGIAPPYGFSMSVTGEEVEYELQTYLDREQTLAAFGVEDTLPSKGGVHAIQPFEPGKMHVALAKAAKAFLPVAGLAALAALMFGGGGTVARATIQNPAQGAEISFEAPSTNRLMAIELEAPLSNNWGFYEMTLVHDESGEEVAEFGKELSYYSGYEGGESWSEGSRSATLRFRPPQTGAYTLKLAEAQESPAKQPLSVEVRKNVFVARWFMILTILFLVLWGSLKLREWAFEAARWGGGEDEDDDD